MPQKYVRGDKAVGICQRCSNKQLRRDMVEDGYYPGLMVCRACADARHPQERLPKLADPVTLYKPAPDDVGYPPALSGAIAITTPQLTWTEAIPINARIDSYDVYRSEDGVNFALVVSLPITYDVFMAITDQDLAYDDVSAVPGTNYTYFVVAKTDPPGPDSLTSNRIELAVPPNSAITVSIGSLTLAGAAPTVHEVSAPVGRLAFAFSLDQALQVFRAPLSNLTDIDTFAHNGDLSEAIDGTRDIASSGGIISLAYSRDGTNPYMLATDDDFQNVDETNGPYAGGGAPIAVAFGAGLFVVGGGNSTVRNAYSADGVAWTQNTTGMQAVMGGGGSINGLDFTNGIFLVATRLGRIGTSPDGINWTLRNSGIPTNQNLSRFASNGAGKIIGAIGGRIVASVDSGVTWDVASYLNAITSTSLNNSFSKFGLAYGNGVWVAGGRNTADTAPFLFSSAVGNEASWTSRSVPVASPAIYSINDIIFDSANNRFIAVASTFNTTGYILTSPDGVTWTVAATVTGLAFNPVNAALAIYAG